MSLTLHLSSFTRKQLYRRLQQAYGSGALRGVRRIQALLALADNQSVQEVAERLNLGPQTIRDVNIRLTHPKKSTVEHRVIIALGVIGAEAPAKLDAGADPVGQANAARTPWAASGSRHGPSVCVWIE